ncbi:MAG: pyrroline-5-carboxylate reductase [Bdellovibrionales bacterium]|nr:pyrroline-5-carboxylate reductase [Bdellovibrionales bacterium]
MKKNTIGIVGLGQMGEAIALGLRETHSISATTKSKESAAAAKKDLKINCHNDNVKLAKECDVLVLCVKPHQAQSVLEEMRSALNSKHLVISIAAGITTEQIRKWTGGKPSVVRAMPNTPCLIGDGMTAYCGASGQTSEDDLAIAGKIFGSIGQAVRVEEEQMDGVTGLSGCGPAYVYLMIESLSEAGVKVGLPRKVATLLAAQTLMGASKMVLERGEHPAALKDEVTTPAGCTIDGLMALEEGKLRVTLIKAVLAATERSRGLRGK